MTVKEAQAIVRKIYPYAFAGVNRGTAWIVVKSYRSGYTISGSCNTKGEAWKDCANRIAGNPPTSPKG